MNSWCVPDFELEDEDLIPSSSGFSRSNKPSLPEDELVELLWQNGQLVMQNQNQKSLKKPLQPKYPNQAEDALTPGGLSSGEAIRRPAAAMAAEEEEAAANHLFMQEDEMASWLHCPLPLDDDSSSFQRDFCSAADDLIYHPAPLANNYASPSNRISQIRDDRPPEDNFRAASPRPPIPSASSSSKYLNFMHFSRPKLSRDDESQPSTSDRIVRGTVAIDSSETPALGPESRISPGPSSMGGGNLAAADRDEELVTCEQTTTMTSSSTGSGVNAEPSAKLSTEDRKRKARETDDHECHSEDAKFEAVNTKKQARGSTSARRARAAEVHNLSERRRRDRINEKMKALQELIPRCNKSDKASMLDEAIEYLKSLQLQVQMMSMGCGMVPLMFPPGVQQYMSPMGMGMGMGMDLSLNRPMMMPYSSVLAARPAVATAHSGPSHPLPAFHVPPPTSNSVGLQSHNLLHGPIFADPYQHYLNNLHYMQVPPAPRPPHQSQAMGQPSTSKVVESDENHKPG